MTVDKLPMIRDQPTIRWMDAAHRADDCGRGWERRTWGKLPGSDMR
jgi:hypothetical protein